MRQTFFDTFCHPISCSEFEGRIYVKLKLWRGDGSKPERGEGGRVTHATFAWCGARARGPPRWLERQESQSFTMGTTSPPHSAPSPI